MKSSIIQRRATKQRVGILPPIFSSILCLLCICCRSVVATAQAQDHPYLRLEAGGHNGPVRAVLFTPNGERVISVGYDKVVRIWDAQGKQAMQLKVLRFEIGEGEIGEITAAAINPDRTKPQLALGVNEGAVSGVRVIDYESGQVLNHLSADGLVSSLKFSHDGARLAVGTGRGTIAVWQNFSALKPMRVWNRVGSDENHARGNYISALAFSPDDKQIVTASHSPDDKQILTTSRPGIQFFDMKSEKPGEIIPSSSVKAVDWSQATGTLAWGGSDGVIHLRNKQQNFDRVLNTRKDGIVCLTFSSDGKQLLSAGGELSDQSKEVHVWSVDQREEVQTFPGHHSTVTAVAFAGDTGLRAVSADTSGRVYVWDTTTGNRIAAFEGEGEALGQVYWSPDGQTVAWGPLNPHLALNHAFSLTNVLPAATPINKAAWQTFSAVYKDMELQARVATQLSVMQGAKELWHIEPGGSIESFTFTPEGDTVVGAGGQLALYSGKKGEQGHLLCKFLGHEGAVFSAAVSPVLAGHPRYLATASKDRTVRLWSLDPNDWQQINGFPVTFPVLSLFMADASRWVAWTQSGYYYASAGGEKMIGWHLNRGVDKPAEFITSQAFYRKFRSADVIRQVASLGDLGRAIAQVNKANNQQLNAQADLAAELKAAPRLELDQVEAAQSDAARALWQTAVSKVKLRLRVLNAPPGDVDLRMQQQHGASEQKTKDLELGQEAPQPELRVLQLSLMPGENTIVVAARRKSGEAAYGPPLTVHIVYKPAQEDNALPSLYALSIGVQQFQDKNINRQGALQYPVSDAMEFAAALRQQQGRAYQKVCASTLTDQQATPDAIKKELSDIKKKVAPGDLVVVFVSSHGLREVPDVNKPGLPNLYFALSQTQLKRPNFFDTALSCDALIHALDDLDPSVRVLIVLDACHAGPLIDAHAYNDGVTMLNRQFYVLASCSATQTSIEDAGLMHGLFTGLLLEALGPNPKRFGDVFQSGKPIPLFQLEFYVRQRIYERLQELKIAHEQYPTFSGPDGGYFPIAQLK